MRQTYICQYVGQTDAFGLHRIIWLRLGSIGQIGVYGPDKISCVRQGSTGLAVVYGSHENVRERQAAMEIIYIFIKVLYTLATVY